MNGLSPLNFSGLIAAERNPRDVNPDAGRAIEVYFWECASCGEHYDDEDEARDCCASEEGGDEKDCPICLSRWNDARDASDCCLWKDFDAPTRWRMADAVHAGSTWAEQLRNFAKRLA